MTEFEKVAIQLIRYLEWATTPSGQRKLKMDGDACTEMIREIEEMIAEPKGKGKGRGKNKNKNKDKDKPEPTPIPEPVPVHAITSINIDSIDWVLQDG